MSQMGDLHPTKHGFGPLSHTSVISGRNAEHVRYAEGGFRRCKKCGYILNEHRHPRVHGEGRMIDTDDYTYDYVLTYDEDDTAYDGYNVNRVTMGTAGCPFCGTTMY